MLSKIWFGVISLVALLLLPANVLAANNCPYNDPLAPPLLPQAFWGTLTIDGTLANAGVEVVVKVDGAFRNNQTTDAGGVYGYESGANKKLWYALCYSDPGKQLDFYARVNGAYYKALETAVANAGDVTQLNLQVWTSQIPIQIADFDPVVGENTTLSEVLSTTKTLDEGAEDGTATYLYAGWAVLGKSGEKLAESGYKQIHSQTANITATYVFPDTGNYSFATSLSFAQLKYANGAWSIVDSGVLESKKQVVVVVAPPVPVGFLSQILTMLATLWNNFLLWISF